jgi:hypothetical protein
MTAIRAASGKRLAVLLALVLGLAGTGIASWAVLTDTLIVTNNYSVQSIDLEGNGEQSLTFDYIFDGPNDPRTGGLLAISNTGSVQLRYAVRASANGPLNFEAITEFWALPSAASAAADCDFILDSGLPGNANHISSFQSQVSLASAGFGNPSAGPDAGDRVIAAGATDNICVETHSIVPNPSFSTLDAATQILTFSAEPAF